MGITVLPGTLLYLDHLPQYILVNVVGFAVAFALTFTLFNPEKRTKRKNSMRAAVTAALFLFV